MLVYTTPPGGIAGLWYASREGHLQQDGNKVIYRDDPLINMRLSLLITLSNESTRPVKSFGLCVRDSVDADEAVDKVVRIVSSFWQTNTCHMLPQLLHLQECP